MTLLVAPYFKHANNATWLCRTYTYTFKGVLIGARFFVLAGAHVLCHGASFLGVSLAKARCEILG